jgi:hypothetical protein
MVKANVKIISQKSEHMWQDNLFALPFEILKPDIKHTNKSFRHITTHVVDQSRHCGNMYKGTLVM